MAKKGYFIQLKESKKGLFLSNEEHVVIMNYVEKTGYSHI